MSSITEKLSSALDGRYRIERHLGEGGMATVYLAYDLKHERKVALKVLKPELAAVLGADRFVQEIKTTANLQHPHILPLFDSGTADGFLFYVMPYIEGEALRDKLNRETQLGVDAAVQIARDVADALEYAHRHGVIHRDIKPENILLQDGRPVVADFGIALAVSAAAGGRMTETGLSLGTPHYMSPEQATAEKELTPRSDVYSLGSVLYEMLTGEPPHMGKSAQQIIMKIVTDRARPVTELRNSVPPHVAAAVAQSLEKLAADRFESAKAFGDALANPAFTAANTRTSASGAASHVAPRTSARRVAFAAMLFAAGALGAVAVERVFVQKRSAAPPWPTHFTLERPDTQVIGVVVVAISPDGRVVAYRAAYPSGVALFTRDLARLGSRMVEGSRHSNTNISMMFSPDGKWLAFNLERDLMRAPVDGGAATVFVRDFGLTFPVWLEGNLLIGSDTAGSLIGVSVASGARHAVIVAKDGTRYRYPAVGDSRSIVLCKQGSTGASDTLAIADVNGSHLTSLGLAARRPLGVVDGMLYFVGVDDALQAVAIDVRGRRLSGAPSLLLPNIGGIQASAMARTGAVALVSTQSEWSLVTVDQRGAETPFATEPRDYAYPRISPDGKHIAVQIGARGRTDIFVRNVAGGALARITTEGTSNVSPEWTYDGKSVLFVSNRSGRNEVWRQPIDFSSTPEQLTLGPGTGRGAIQEVVASPDGQHLLVRLNTEVSGQDVYSMALSGDRALRVFVQAPRDQLTPRFSPDGRWVAYVSSESGDYEVYVQPFPGPGPRVQVSVGGGRVPVWSSNGRTLYYWRSSQVFAVDVQAGTTFVPGPPRLLFSANYRGGTLVHAGYDVTPDGGFVFAKPARPATVEVVLNLASLLRGENQTSGAAKQ